MQVTSSQPPLAASATSSGGAIPPVATTSTSNSVERPVEKDQPSGVPSEGGKLGSAAPSSNTKNESLAVQMLTKQVEQIKEALGREQQQLKVAQGRASHDDGAGVEVMMLSAAVNTTSGQLTNASAQLVAAILAESDASKGALLDVVA